MKVYGMIEDGKIVNKKVYDDVPEGIDDLLKAGYKEVITVKEPHNPATHDLGDEVVVEKADTIERQFPAVQLPASVINEGKISTKMNEMLRGWAITELNDTDLDFKNSYVE